MRTSRILVVVLAFFCALGLNGQTSAGAHPLTAQTAASGKAPFFPVAVWYSGGKSRAPMISRHPLEERADWDHELATIHQLGFNTVRTWVDWATSEPREGQYNFTDLKQLLELAEKHHLRVIVQIYADSAPDWVGKKFPDAEFQTATGVKIPSQAAPGYSFDQPGVRAAMLDFYTHVARVAAASPAFYAYDLWSEPHLVNWVWFNDLPNAQFGFNPYTQARFREWLKHKYGSLAALNEAWYRTFQGWDEVEAPRFGTILSYTDFMDWKAFIADKIAADLGMKAAAVRRADPTHIVSSHSDAPSVLTSPLHDYGMPDDWKMFKEVDYYGASIYPKHASAQLHGWDAAMRAFSFDGSWSASRGKGFYIGELQGGQGATGLRVNDPVTADDERDWTWSLIAHGAKAICYYAWYPMNAGYESNGYGLINLDGSITGRAREAGHISSIVTRHAEVFQTAKPQRAKIALLYNPLSYLSGGDTVAPGTAVRDSMVGIYRALFDQNISVEFVHADQAAAGALKNYQAVYLPYAITLPRADGQALAEYVRQGGTVISEARLAWNDERGFANDRIPGEGLDQVFGVHEAQLWPGTKATYRFSADAPDGMAGLEVPAMQFKETLNVDRGQVLARFDDGTPAVVASTWGKGKTIFIGSFLGMAAQQPDNTGAIKLVQALARWAGIQAPVQVNGAQPGDVEARLLNVPAGDHTTGGTLLIAINRGPAADLTFTLHQSAAHAIDLQTDQSVTVDAGDELHAHLNHEGVAIILLQR